MQVKKRTFTDDNGNEISEEEFNVQWQEFQNAYMRKYNQIVDQIVIQINNRCKTNKQKLEMLFEFLTSDDMQYDLGEVTDDGRRTIGFQYEFPPYKKWGIENGSKYAVILNHKGVCCSYAEAFEDISKKLGIPCKIINGYTGMDHAWNVVKEKGVLKHIDVAYALMKNRKDKYNYFMKTFEELQKFAGKRTITDSLEDIEKELNSIEFVVKSTTPAKTKEPTQKKKFVVKEITPGD